MRKLRGFSATLTLCAALAVGLGLAACSNSAAGAPTRKITKLNDKNLPKEMAGLTLKSEPTTQADSLKRPYIDSVGLFSLRSGELLQATLQIGKMASSSAYKSVPFQKSIVTQIGTTEAKAFRVGTHTVYLTTGERQSIAIWFHDRDFFILSTRGDYKTPRTLLRAALELKP